MQPSSDIAFKEWAVVCAAIGSGRQTIILRKGGIDEGRAGFRIEHSEFWLLPTRFHQDPSEVVPDAQPLWQQARHAQSLTGRFFIDLYAVVQEVWHVQDLAKLERLAGEHILSPITIEQRFSYRYPGIFVLAVRTYRAPNPYEVPETPHIAGCKSWVHLPEALSTSPCVPVFAEAAFAEKLQSLKNQVEN